MEQARGNMQTHHNVLQKAMEKGATGLDKEPQPTKRERRYSSRVSHTSLHSRSRPAREWEKNSARARKRLLRCEKKYEKFSSEATSPSLISKSVPLPVIAIFLTLSESTCFHSGCKYKERIEIPVWSRSVLRTGPLPCGKYNFLFPHKNVTL